jgi:hypothetical protein
MLVFVFIRVLLVGDSRRKLVLYVLYSTLPTPNSHVCLRLRLQVAIFPIHHGNLGVRALPLEFGSCLAWRFFNFHSLLVLLETTIWTEPSTWRCTVPQGALPHDAI